MAERGIRINVFSSSLEALGLVRLFGKDDMDEFIKRAADKFPQLGKTGLKVFTKMKGVPVLETDDLDDQDDVIIAGSYKVPEAAATDELQMFHMDDLRLLGGRVAFQFLNQRRLLHSWDFSDVPCVDAAFVDKIYRDNVANFSAMPEKQYDKELKLITETVLAAIAPYFSQKIWREQIPINLREKGVRLPDLASVDVSSTLQNDQIDWSQFKLLFEVEPNIIETKRSSLSKTKIRESTAEEGQGQWMQWVSQVPPSATRILGAVTNYEYWIFHTAVKTSAGWQFYYSRPCAFIGQGKMQHFIEVEKSAFGKLVQLFSMSTK